jgi:excisionase family DNA binding protein
MNDELLTVKEVAARLKLNPQTVRRWIRSGRLRAIQIAPRRYRIREDDLAAVPEVSPERIARHARTLERLLARRAEFSPEQFEQDWRAIEGALAFRRELEQEGVKVSVAELIREARDEETRREISAGTLPPPTPEEVEARLRAMDRLRALRPAFNRPGPTLQEILDEERREEEGD